MSWIHPKQLARGLAHSPAFQGARDLWERNQQDFNLPLSKLEKLLVGVQLILRDYSEGRFPPTFDDQQRAYDAEIAYRRSLPGQDVSNVTDALMRKPFWFGKEVTNHLTDFLLLTGTLSRLGVHPPQRLLELGCGSGWMAEFLAVMKFDVVGTSISPDDIQDARGRMKGLDARQITSKLDFRVAAMESVNEVVQDRVPFDCTFVYEALHHAYDWRRAIRASYECLKPGGWLVIANEPNAVHVFASYRVARLSNTHEIGFRRNALRAHLKQTGFESIEVLRNRVGLYVRPHWIAAQKGG